MNQQQEELVTRFLRYVAVPTQSTPGVKEVPSSAGQWDLAKLLQKECAELGLEELHLSEHCVLTGKLPARLPAGCTRSIPAVGFVTHLDTADISLSPEVKPQLIRYDGGDVVLNKEQQLVMKVAEHPELKDYQGQEIIFTDGTSVLGSDNKAAVTNVMTALATLARTPELYHGDVYVAFVPDEEVGLRGSKSMEFDRFPVAFAYTIDCCALGEVVYETFNAGSAQVTIKGISAHPMSAKGVLINPILVATDFLNLLDRRQTPECTEGKEGFIHCKTMSGNPSKAVLSMNIRDHSKSGYEAKKAFLTECVRKVQAQHPRAQISCELTDIYGNIADAITPANRKAIDYIYAALDTLQITPHTIAMRGGTDGSFISTKGILTPNYFTGGLNFHSQYEFLPVPSLEKAYQVTMELIKLIYNG